MCSNKYIMTRWSYSFFYISYYLIIIIKQTYLEILNFLNACQVQSVSSVCLRSSQFSQSSFMQYIGLYEFSVPISLMMIVRICVLYLIIIIKSEVSPICYCFWLCHETMICAVCLFCILIDVSTYTMLGLKLIHVSRSGPDASDKTDNSL